MIRVVIENGEWKVKNNHVASPDANHTNNGAPIATSPHSLFSVRLLHQDNMADWSWHPAAMARVVRFCRDYEQQADPVALIRNLRQAFTSDDPGLMVIAFIRDDERLIGHILCDRAFLYYRPIVTVHQYMLDEAIPDEAREEAVRLVRAWAKETGPEGLREPATEIQWLVRDKKLARMYQRFFKAKPHLLLMRMPVEED